MIKKWSVSYPAVNGTEQRRVYVYLPTMYEADPDRRYPVLYMFDGQNVFFRRGCYLRQELGHGGLSGLHRHAAHRGGGGVQRGAEQRAAGGVFALPLR